MTEVKVNCQKLSDSLEDAIDITGQSYFRRLYLRMPICGVVSTAIDLHLRERGVSLKTVESHPHLSFHQGMEHVVNLIDDDPKNPLVVDGTYGQFLMYKGYDIAYDNLLKMDMFPEARVMAFRLNERGSAIRGIAKIAMKFPPKEEELAMELGFKPGDDWLPEANTVEAVAEAIDPIWNPVNFHPYEPNRLILEKAKELANHIDPSAITIS